MGEDNSKEYITCNNCNGKIEQNKKFCTGCGDPIVKNLVKHNLVESNLKNDPSCGNEIIEGKKFCTKCGQSVVVDSLNTNNSTTNTSQNDDTLDNLKTSGLGLMKGLGGFLDKTAAAIDDNLAQNKSSYKNKDIRNRLTEIREKKIISPGYLVCDACGGYYELQTGEDPDDFSDECECGGCLVHQSNLSV